MVSLRRPRCPLGWCAWPATRQNAARELASAAPIQEQAQRNNARVDITGVLLFNREYFLQCLEGEREQVTHAFNGISADERHHHISLMSMKDIEERAYPDWSMGLLDGDSPSLKAALDDVLPDGVLEPATMTADTALLITLRMRTLRFTR